MSAEYTTIPPDLRGQRDPDDKWIKAQLLRIEPHLADHETEHLVAQATRKLVLELRDKLEAHEPLAGRAKYLIVEAEVRYWEDAKVNGEEDTQDGTLIPLRDGKVWKPVIRLEDGKIMGWPEGTTANVHYKVCDQGEYFLGDEQQKKIGKWCDSYVPNDFLCHGSNGYADYIIFKVGPDGVIEKWTRPDIDEGEWDKMTGAKA